jgi:hypothetical protein
MSNPADILPIIAPEIDAAKYSGGIEVAEMQIAAGLCGDKRPMLVAYLAAHILTLSGRAGVSGAVTAQSEGGLSESYGQVMGGRDALASTSYGAEYDRMSRACVFAPRTRCM